jgi:hypothetical protein
MTKYAPQIEELAKLLSDPAISADHRAVILSAIDWAEYLRAQLANSQWGEGTWRMKYNLLQAEVTGKPCLKP